MSPDGNLVLCAPHVDTATTPIIHNPSATHPDGPDVRGTRTPHEVCDQIRLVEDRVRTLEELGFRGDAMEALAFAILANEFVHQSPANMPGATGADRRVALGKICF